MQFQMFDSGFCLDCNFLILRHAVVIYVFSDAADSIAAHGAFGSVRVIHLHAEIRFVRRTDQDQAV